MSLCLIVKDEEETIERCLASASRIADELVVYDTGSADKTVELARAMGATVVEGSWHDDFGRARNEALSRCHGTWILHLDADEELDFDPAAIRRGLSRADDVDALLIEIRNVGARGGEYTHFNRRLFRRARAHWKGRLHERVESRDARPLREANLLGGQIIHHGYAEEVVTARGKSARNIRIAHAELAQAGPSDDVAGLMVNVARSYGSTGDPDMALDWFRRARDVEGSESRKVALRLGAQLLTDAGDFAEARRWIDELEAAGTTPEMIAWLRGSVDLVEGSPAHDLADLHGIDSLMGEDGMGVPERTLRLRIAMALASAQRWEEASSALLDVAITDPDATVWGLVATCLDQGGLSLDHAVAAVPEDHLRQVLAQLLNEPVASAERFGLALLERFAADPRMVAFAVHHARRLDDLEAMLTWSTVIRNGHLEESCPVIDRAGDPTVPAPDRFMAAVVAHAAFRDPRSLDLLGTVSELLTPAEEPDAIHVLTELAPELVVAD